MPSIPFSCQPLSSRDANRPQLAIFFHETFSTISQTRLISVKTSIFSQIFARTTPPHAHFLQTTGEPNEA
jgi:hypothetical protein